MFAFLFLSSIVCFANSSSLIEEVSLLSIVTVSDSTSSVFSFKATSCFSNVSPSLGPGWPSVLSANIGGGTTMSLGLGGLGVFSLNSSGGARGAGVTDFSWGREVSSCGATIGAGS